MKIAILGTRGIPNRYGGFEQCAEKLSLRWVAQGEEVTVYCPTEHPNQEKVWRNVKRRLIPSFEERIGPWGTLLYDFLCLKDALRRDFDVILNLGYVPGAAFFPSQSSIPFVTNMDGLEWKRKKWSPTKRRFARWCERRAVERSHWLIADNPAIEAYLHKEYGASHLSYIPYGAEIPGPPRLETLERYRLRPYGYFLTVARLEPENNLDLILEGYHRARVPEPFLVVGNLKTPYARKLYKEFSSLPGVYFLGALYDYKSLSTLRRFAKLYFHGHSVGGTNPSLLEAMASEAYIAAHDNVFNREVLGKDAFYFRTIEDVERLLKEANAQKRPEFTQKNLAKIKEIYNWDRISRQYLELFRRISRKL